MKDITIQGIKPHEAITLPISHVLGQLWPTGVLSPTQELLDALDALTEAKNKGDEQGRQVAIEQYRAAKARCHALIFSAKNAKPTPEPIKQSRPAGLPPNGWQCKCGAWVVKTTTRNAKQLPVNYVQGVNYKDAIYDPTRHVSHFDTCPNASDFKKKEPARQPFSPPKGVTKEQQAQLFGPQ